MYKCSAFPNIVTILMALMLCAGCSDGSNSSATDSNNTSQLAPIGYGQFNDAQLEDMREIRFSRRHLRNQPVEVQAPGLPMTMGEQRPSPAKKPMRFTVQRNIRSALAVTLFTAQQSAPQRKTTRTQRVAPPGTGWKITRYPSRAHYVDMYDAAGYQAALVHKDAGVETAIVMVSELTMSSTRDGLPPESSPESIHLGELLKFKKAAQYDAQQESAIRGRDAYVLYEKEVMRDSIKVRAHCPRWRFFHRWRIGRGWPNLG